MKSKLIAVLLLTGSSMFAGTRFYFGVGVGAPLYAPPPPIVTYYAPPPAPVAVVPRAPGLGYTWIGGYWYPVHGRYAWRAGYWTRAPFVGARWVAPRYHAHRYYRGYWRR